LARAIADSPAAVPVIQFSKGITATKETPSIFPVKTPKAEQTVVAKPQPTPETPAVPTTEPEKEFSEEELNAAWIKFFSLKSPDDTSDSLKMIGKRSIQKKENGLVEIVLSTDIERKFLKAEETEIVQFLRKELGARLLTFSIAVKEADARQKLYTDKEKFNYLAEKHPLLLKLKEKLFLETDF